MSDIGKSSCFKGSGVNEIKPSEVDWNDFRGLPVHPALGRELLVSTVREVVEQLTNARYKVSYTGEFAKGFGTLDGEMIVARCKLEAVLQVVASQDVATPESCKACGKPSADVGGLLCKACWEETDGRR